MRMLTSIKHMLVAVVIAVMAAAPSLAMDMEPVWLGTPFMEGWVPERADAVRGVLIMNGSSSVEWFEAAAAWKFAILRINTDKYGSKMPEGERYADLSGKGNLLKSVVKQGLEELGKQSGHPEIEHVPLVPQGFSRYSSSAPQIMKLFPQRALCYMNGNGGGGTDPLTNLATPNIGMQCEWENIFSGGDKSKLLGQWWKRSEGNLAMCSIHWRVYHNPNSMPDLGIVFVDEVIKARIPADWDPKKGPCKLKPVREADGWLGSHEGWRVPADKILDVDNQNAHIAPISKFKHDPARASWLISERMAWTWRAFSSRFPKARFIEPGWPSTGRYSAPSPPAIGHREAGVRAGEPFVVKVEARLDNLTKIELFVNTEARGEMTKFEGGETAVGSTHDATVSTQITIDTPGVHVLMGRYHTADGESGWMRPIPLVVTDAVESIARPSLRSHLLQLRDPAANDPLDDVDVAVVVDVDAVRAVELTRLHTKRAREVRPAVRLLHLEVVTEVGHELEVAIDQFHAGEQFGNVGDVILEHEAAWAVGDVVVRPQVVAIAVIHRQSMVATVGDPQFAMRVEHDAVRALEPPRAFLAGQRRDVTAVGVPPMNQRRAVTVGDPDIAVGRVHRDPRRHILRINVERLIGAVDGLHHLAVERGLFDRAGVLIGQPEKLIIALADKRHAVGAFVGAPLLFQRAARVEGEYRWRRLIEDVDESGVADADAVRAAVGLARRGFGNRGPVVDPLVGVLAAADVHIDGSKRTAA